MTDMRAVLVTETGGPEVLTETRRERPAPGAGEVLVEVAFAGVNFADIYVRRGQAGLTGPVVPGMEVSGIVVELGEGVDDLKVGQPVAAFCQLGGYAEFVAVGVDRVFALPDDGEETLLAGAVFPTTVPTAWLELSRAANLRPGEVVLVHAAAGALGSVLVQVAKQLGAGQVIGVTSTAVKAAFARRQGFDTVYLSDEWLRAVEADGLVGRIDVAVESTGGQTLLDTRSVLAPLGRVVVCGNSSWSDDVQLSSLDLWIRNCAIVGFNIGGLFDTARQLWRRGAEEALDLVIEGNLTVPVLRRYAFDEVALAHKELESRASVGKLALRVKE